MDLHVNSDFSLEIKKEKIDSYEDDINNNVSETINNKTDRNLKDIMGLNENEIKQMSYFANTLPNSTANTTGTAFTLNTSTNTGTSNPFVLPPHIFFPSTPAAEEGTQQKYVLYKCGVCGKAFASLRVICGHLALHNDTSKEKDCEKCGASFKWKTELDSHLECHQTSDRKFMPTSPFLPSYYVNPFPIPVVTPSEQSVMSTTPLQPQTQPSTNNHEETVRNSSRSPSENSPTAENFEDKNLVQGCNFQCKVCPKTFDRAFSLQRHERIHSGVKACFCKICGRGFSELRNLRHHIIRFHEESAQKEPLPYRRRPNRMRNVSSSQKLVSFLKKTAVRILNSMGQSKSESATQPEQNDNSADKQSAATNASQEFDRNDTQNFTNTVPTNTAENLQEQNTLSTMPTLFDATSQVTRLSPSQDLNEVPPPKLSPGVSEDLKDLSAANKIETGNNGAVEVLQDPKRSLLGNRRKGRPFKLSTMSSQSLNLGSDDILFPLADTSFLEKHADAISESSLLQATEILNGCLKPEVAFPQLNYYNMEQSPNEPIDMRNPIAKEKSEVPLKKEIENNEVQDRNAVFPTENNLGMNVFNDTTPNSAAMKMPESYESRCLFPCSYCHKSFNSITDINRHMSFHADIRPFKCPYCSYCSRTNSQLKVHMMRHEGIKHYMCQICNYNGVTQSDLNRHLKTRTHLLRSRNVCACCGTGFHTRSLSDEHYKSCHLATNSGSNNQDQNSKNQSELTNKTSTSNNRNRVTRLKQFRTPEEKIKTEFYQKLYDLNNMGLTLGDFLQQSPATAMNLEK
ncbi:uncharacterized protein CEXT_346412 [Caerostris extrusa]|uniref:C2H2-type domain-containing protein n=1 Tax=Caerostris extrusa TaxID=172846 RepID=A0AAV4VM20_CAEEX|nr:uncharacterized protein CEXT_346412 [Caerostris extrusa]